MVCVKVASPIPLIPSMTTAWLVLLFVMLSYYVFNGGVKCNKFLISFIVTAVLGLIIMNPESYFKSWERLFGFILHILLLSPLLSSPTIERVKKIMFSYTFYGLKLVMFASFVAYFLGINLADKNSRDAYWAFSGITNQSMVLSPISGLCLIQGVWVLITQKPGKLYKLFLIVQSLCSIWCILVAGSRGALLGGLVSVALIFVRYGSYQKIAKYVLVIMIGALFLSDNIIDKAFYTINIKQENHAISASNITSTRQTKWEARIAEFVENPILGCGFASQTHYTSDDLIWYIKETGGLEPGSSWLCILAMTGLLGFLTLGGAIIKASKDVWISSKNNVNAIFFLSLWMLFLINGMFEGWIFYSGGFVFYLWWLLFGTMVACSKHDYKIQIY